MAHPTLERARLREFLKTEDLYVYTVNAFPYGPFKRRRVMEDVYEPDWSTDDRVRYTCDVADVLANMVEDGISPTIQSAPLAFRPKVSGPSDVAALTHNLFRVVTHLIQLERTTGTRVKLALEPEPFCFLETTQETVDYFNTHVYSVAGTRALVEMTGQPASEVFTDTIYLSQTTQLRDGVTTKFLNLIDAIAAWKASPGGDCEWRTHFHVPVFSRRTRVVSDDQGIAAALRVHAQAPVSDHLEIETYTWDVLPAHLKAGDITDYVVRELEWVRDELGAGK